jgi:glycyl-tRNA synthetase beta chain
VSGKAKSRKSEVEGREAAPPAKTRKAASSREKTLPLLVEIGCEEIPARYLDDGQTDFGNALINALGEARLLPEGPSDQPLFQTASTPRRLAVWVPRVLERQSDRVEEVLGPPVKVAFDAQGKPTRAAESFAEKNSVRVRDLTRATTPKGEYVALRKTTQGLAALQVLTGLVPRVALALSFPKSMYWAAKSGPRFVRPIRWLVALLGEGKQARIVPFEIVGVRASDTTHGHRTVAKNSASVEDFEDYVARLHKLQVEVDPEKRRERVRKECKVLLEKFHLTVVPDKELEDWIVNSTEWPTGLVGGFDARFLHLPREILITVMRGHQKYFAVEDAQGNLQARFLTVLNVAGDPKGLIRAGHKRVLAARFSDAEFFWNSDQRVPLRDRQEALAGVTYQAELGSYADKVRRMTTLAREICAELEEHGRVGFGAAETEMALRAVELSKCDLTTQMVYEFPELQGVVGGLYARAQGEAAEVAEAIYDHYLPQSMESRSPRSAIGAVVSLADKLDSVVSGFAVGLEPTGSSDPFALRRAGNGVIKVLVELSLPIPLRAFVERAINQLDVRWLKPQVEVFTAISSFLEDRLKYYLESSQGFRFDTVRAVLAAGWDTAPDAALRAEALEKIRDTADFEALSVAAKRIKNILAKSAGADDWQPGEVDPAMLEADEERTLHKAFGEVLETVEKQRAAGEYEKALQEIARLRQPVDRFFDKVLVMAENPEVRQNRLRLLGKLDELFSGIARFAEIATGPGNVDASTSKSSGK